MNTYDKIIMGAGLYGLYAALFCAKRGERILVLEYDDAAFKRATYINQARVHMGYHYPRSYSTAIKSATYFQRFIEDYGFCIQNSFNQVYATSNNFSWCDAKQFKLFCDAVHIRCDEVSPASYFKEGFCDGAFLTEEYAFDAQLLKQYFIEQLKNYPKVEMRFGAKIRNIVKGDISYSVDFFQEGNRYAAEAPFVLNATYASVNQIQHLLGFEMFRIKYELCEIILCKVSEKLHNTGLTVMDGHFFSVMPFGKTNRHSLTSVAFTPHVTSKDALPAFDCQNRSNGICSPQQLSNCNDCLVHPESAWPYMSSLARKYMRDDFSFEYDASLYSMKPILLTSEIDDSRPTVIRTFSENPYFVSVLSGKINTVYDLDAILSN